MDRWQEGDRRTIDVYERRATEWRDARSPKTHHAATAFGRTVARSRAEVGAKAVVDLGCGPGWCAPHVGSPVVAVDAARAMLQLVPDEAPGALRVQADLQALPFRSGSLGAAWANKSYVHVARTALPLALADLHRALAVGAPIELRLFCGDEEHGPLPDDDFAGRLFSHWRPDHLHDVLDGAGFERLDVAPATPGKAGLGDHLVARGVRARTLPDYVGPNMRLLSVGLNPSLYAADEGVGFARPGNRFWPAALKAGLVTQDRDPRHALVQHGVGMSDFVKRASVGAAELTAAEYREGVARLERLVAWLRPGVVCFQGLAGWRAAVDKKATSGPIEGGFAGQPAYLMPNPSGLNASSSLDDLAEHLRRAASLADT
jgi:TDG/mug DNA glycosylase family protein